MDDNTQIREMRVELRRLNKENRRLRRVWVFDQLMTLGIDTSLPASLRAIEHYRFEVDDEGHPDMSLQALKRYLVEESGTVVGEGI